MYGVIVNTDVSYDFSFNYKLINIYNEECQLILPHWEPLFSYRSCIKNENMKLVQ